MRRLIERTGSLFDSDAPVIGHGCNTKGAMASGIALQFASRWPDMESKYRKVCHDGSFKLGDVMYWRAGPGRMIANMMTQVNPGADGRYLGILGAVNKVLQRCRVEGWDRLALPRIGCGIAGLTWDGGVRNLLAECSDEIGVDIEVWTPRFAR